MLSQPVSVPGRNSHAVLPLILMGVVSAAADGKGHPQPDEPLREAFPWKEGVLSTPLPSLGGLLPIAPPLPPWACGIKVHPLGHTPASACPHAPPVLVTPLLAAARTVFPLPQPTPQRHQVPQLLAVGILLPCFLHLSPGPCCLSH